MSETTKTADETAIDRIVSRVAECRETLEKLADTCCMPARSERMRTLTTQVDRLAAAAPGTRLADDQIDALMQKVSDCGSAAGALFATCCTPAREKLYVQLMKALGDIYLQLLRLQKRGH